MNSDYSYIHTIRTILIYVRIKLNYRYMCRTLISRLLERLCLTVTLCYLFSLWFSAFFYSKEDKRAWLYISLCRSLCANFRLDSVVALTESRERRVVARS